MNGNWTGTYRLQLHAKFPLQAAAEIVPYLAKLGISHVYLSPCLQAAPGSMHGYDVTDPTRINNELGGEEGWKHFQEEAKKHGLKVLLDIVPNHMAAVSSNPWWDDLLAKGPDSEFAEYFDIHPHTGGERWKINLCVLGEPYGEALEKKLFSIERRDGEPRLRYFDHTWPLNAESQKLLADIKDDSKQMHEVLEAQYYRLAWWKLESELVNYRRFFNIGTLIGMRIEKEEVFAATHKRIGAMARAGEVDGLRIDHPDGLRDPQKYLERVRKLLPYGKIYVEKILDSEEELPGAWPVDGTVGYDFLSKVNRLWMYEHSKDALTAIYSDFTGESVNFPAMVREKKRQILNAHFQADLQRLAALGMEIAQSSPAFRDISPVQLREALCEFTASLPIYRTYRARNSDEPQDLKVLGDTLKSVRGNMPHIDARVFDFLNDTLCGGLADLQKEKFVLNWQQLAPAVMAKGAEDTTFYCYDRLVSCNEVGAQPSLLGISAEKFHQYCSYLGSHWPHNLLATSTHDNKRSEDVRTRISVLSEIPDKWASALQEWSRRNEPAWKGRSTDRHAEYLLYQTLVGAWPISKERCWQYMLKACREAKIRTSWHEPNEAYEDAIREFTESVMDDAEFMKSLAEFVQPLVLPAQINSLAQALIKMTAPGIPDFYQGTELWDLSLVDPDNRRPVGFTLRNRLLEESGKMEKYENSAEWSTGMPKIWMIRRVLDLRAKQPDLFQGDYRPLAVQGTKLGHLLGYLRGEKMAVLVPRFTLVLDGKWGDTTVNLPRGQWTNIFAQKELEGEIAAETLFDAFPVALLVKK